MSATVRAFPDISAIILCGGKASRMAGEDKGLVVYRRKPLVQHVIERITPQVDDIVISANRNLDLYRDFSSRVISDTHDGYAGPLAGIASCLSYCKHDRVLVVACDMPLLPENLVDRLMPALVTSQIAIACCQQHPQLAFILRRELLDSLTDSLQLGDFRLMQWIERHDPGQVQFEDCDAFTNINSRDDLSRLS